MYRKIYKTIKNYDSIVIARHIGVDPDAMGGQIALRDSIRESFPNKKVYAVGMGGSKFSYMGSLDSFDGDPTSSLVIVLDTPDKKRVDLPNIDEFKYKIKIDHHIFVEEFCDIELVDEKSSSVCQMIIEMLYKTKLVKTKKVMENLFLGLVSDTNRFMFSNSTSSTYLAVSKVLRDFDLDVPKLYENLYMRPLNEVRLQGYISQNMIVTENGVGYFIIKEDTLTKFHADVASPGNMINNFNYIDEILVWVGITEDKKNNIVKINLRSRGPEINTVAEKYNGGGHKLACGARVSTFEEADNLINDLDYLCGKYIELQDKED